MSQHYGQDIVYGVLGAPSLFTGDKVSFSYRSQATKENQENGGSDFTAMAIHSLKGELNFEAEVTSGSNNFLDLSGGARIVVAGTAPAGLDLSTGFILAEECVEEITLMRRKRCSVRAWHYPDAPTSTVGAAAVNVNVFDTQDLTELLFPGNTLNYSTVGFEHAAGVVHGVRLTQRNQITDDEPSPEGKILGAFVSGYERILTLTLLAKPSEAVIPEVKSQLVLTGAPARMNNYRVISAGPRLERKRGMMFEIEAAWIPPFAS